MQKPQVDSVRSFRDKKNFFETCSDNQTSKRNYLFVIDY